MGAARKLEIVSRECRVAANQPALRLHRCRLNYDAALREHLRGGCAARVAIAAGSGAKSRRNLRRVGLKIVARLPGRADVLATFERLGFSLEDFCRGIIEQTKATKRKRYFHRGRMIGNFADPDWRERGAALRMYAEATGLFELPLAVDGEPGSIDGDWLRSALGQRTLPNS